MDKITWPDRLTEYKWIQSPWYRSAGQFVNPPSLIVVHSGACSPNVAEYLLQCKDRTVSVHFAWSGKEHGFVQMVGLNWRAWHAGGGMFLGDRRVNSFSLGVELPGPFNRIRDDAEMRAVFTLLVSLRGLIPSLVNITSHAAINPKHRKDPGPHFDWKLIEDTGLVAVLDRARDKPDENGKEGTDNKVV